MLKHSKKTQPQQPNVYIYTCLLEPFLLHLPRLQHKRPQKTPLNLQYIRHILGLLYYSEQVSKTPKHLDGYFCSDQLSLQLTSWQHFTSSQLPSKRKPSGPRTCNSLSSLSCVTNHAHDANPKPYRLMPRLRITCSRKPEHDHGKCSSESHSVGQIGFPQKIEHQTLQTKATPE